MHVVTQVSNVTNGTDIHNTEHKQRVKRKQRLEFLIMLVHEPVGMVTQNMGNTMVCSTVAAFKNVLNNVIFPIGT